MKIFVTGGAGYIGSHTCKELSRAGHECRVYDNLSAGHREFARYGSFIYGDIGDYRNLRRALEEYKPDAVIHFAAFAYVGESVRDPGKYFRNNVAGTLSLLEAMRDSGVSNLVVSGTCAVYGAPASVPIREDATPSPINPYGASKLFMERMLSDFEAAHDLRWVSLRYFNAAGSSPDLEIGELHEPETHLIPRALLASLGKLPPLEIFGSDYPTPDGSCIRDYIDVADLARAHIKAVEYLLAGGQPRAFNLGTGKGASVFEIIRLCEEITGKNVPAIQADRRPGDPAELVADASQAAAILGWKPVVDLREMIANSARFLEKNA